MWGQDVFNVNISKYFIFILDFGVWVGPAAASAASGPATRGVEMRLPTPMAQGRSNKITSMVVDSDQ